MSLLHVEVRPEPGTELANRGSLFVMEQHRVVLVTGSAVGIGRAVAWRFAERGFDVTVNYSKSKAEAEETAEGVRARGGQAIVVQADVADDMAVRAMVERTVETLGGLDVLVNNAATTY